MGWRKSGSILVAIVASVCWLSGCAGSGGTGQSSSETSKAEETKAETSKVDSTKTDSESVSSSGSAGGAESSASGGTESDNRVSASGGTESDNRVSASGGTESDNPVSVSGGTESDNPVSASGGTESDNRVSASDGTEADDPSASADETESDKPAASKTLTLWTYAIGGFGDEKQLQELVDDFCKEYPDVDVDVRILDYSDGDQVIEEAIESGETPDLVFEGPERLVANWGARDLLVPLNDMWEDEITRNMYIKVAAACHNLEGVYYVYPVGMMVHTMALNRDIFEAADALQYVDEESGTWKSEDFEKALAAVHDYLLKEGDEEGVSGIIYCKDQGGDQGTRALVTNLNSGTFTNASHTEYTIDSDENVNALKAIASMAGSGLVFDSKMNGGDEIALFCNGDLPMALCWNCSVEEAHPDVDFDILPVTFPSDDGVPELCGGIYGFGIFDNGDEEQIELAKDFIRFFTTEPEEYKKAVRAVSAFPVMETVQGDELSDLYADDEVMNQYVPFMQYFGDYYQVVPGWPEARTAWWKMLQEIGDGTDVEKSVETFEETVSAAVETARG